jgi:hypothetical protein
LFWRCGAQASEGGLGESLRVGGRKVLVEDDSTEIEGAAEDVLGELKIRVGADLTPLDCAAQHLISGLSSRIDEVLGEDCGEFGRMACLGNQRLDDSPGRQS